MTQFILPNGTEAELQALITVGDAAFDTSNKVVRVGDGSTLGGIVLADAETLAREFQPVIDDAKAATEEVTALQATVAAANAALGEVDDRATALEKSVAGLDASGEATGEALASVQQRATALEKSVAAIGVTDTGWPRGPHKFWRVRVTASTSTYGALKIAGVEFRAAPNGVDQTGGGVAIASVQNADGSYPASNCFDRNDDSEWIGSGGLPQWIGYQFAAPVSVNEVAIRAMSDTAPNAFEVDYSDDGVTWTLAWSVNGQINWPANRETRAFADPLYGQYSERAVLTPPVDGQLYALRGNGDPKAWEPVPTGGGSALSANLTLLRAAAARGFFPAPLALAETGITVTLFTDSNGQTLPARPGTTKLPPNDPRISMEGGVVTTQAAPGNFGGDWFLCRSVHPTANASASYDHNIWSSGGTDALEFDFAGTDLWIDGLQLQSNNVNKLFVDGALVWSQSLSNVGNIYFRLQFPTATKRRVRFEHVLQFVLGITSPTPNLITAADPKPVVPWLGDSFIGGSATQPGDDPDDGFALLSQDAGRALGWNLYDSGIGGTGLIHANGSSVCYMDRLEDLTLEGLGGPTPNAAILWMSDNDNGATPAEQARFAPSTDEANQYAALYSADRNTPALQAQFGHLTANAVEVALHRAIRHWLGVVGDGAPLIIIGPWSNSGQSSARPLPIVTYQVRDAAARTARSYRSRNVHFIDQLVPDLFAGDLTDPTTMAHYYTRGDLVHPNTHGGAFRGLTLARQIEAVLFGQAR